MPRCPCESTPEAGPSTHRGVIHLSSCKHSQLEKTTRPYRKPPKVRKIIGTKKVIRVEQGDDGE